MSESSQGGDLVGKTLGQYQIRDQLGQGGMATVYLAYQPSIDRTVAIKVMPTYFMHDPSFLQRFEREVKVIARLQHPRIVPVFDYGQVEGRPYIVMAYMPSGTLADRIKEGPLPLQEAARLVEQIAEGLDHAHREGVIHRDFKPSNVLLDKNGNAHLADFGIAKISESTVQLTGSGVVGTPAYMAPEMASEGIVTTAVDIYALGVTLYQMLTGKYPFAGDTPLRVMMAHATEPVPDARAVRADLPAGVAEVVRRAMAKDPADRYASAAEMARALRAAVEGQVPQAGPAARPASGVAATVIEEPVGTPATPPPGTPVPPSGTPVPGWSSTPPPTPAPAYTPAPAGYAPPAAQKRGCSGPVLYIGLALGGLLVLCLGIGAATGLLATVLPSLSPTQVLPTITAVPSNTPLPPTERPTDAPTTAPATPGGGSTGELLELLVTNESTEQICYLYITETDATDWGPDQLGSDVVVVGDDYTITDIPPGSYDVKTEDCEYNVISWNFELEFETGDYTLTVSGADDHVIVVNEGSQPLCAVYVSPSDADTWGRSFVDPSVPIAVGSQRSIPVTPGTWDLRADTCNDLSAEEYNVEISGDFTWSVTD